MLVQAYNGHGGARDQVVVAIVEGNGALQVATAHARSMQYRILDPTQVVNARYNVNQPGITNHVRGQRTGWLRELKAGVPAPLGAYNPVWPTGQCAGRSREGIFFNARNGDAAAHRLIIANAATDRHAHFYMQQLQQARGPPAPEQPLPPPWLKLAALHLCLAWHLCPQLPALRHTPPVGL